MESFEKLAAKARASRQAKGQAPVVETVEDAVALAQAVAQQLDSLTGDARLLMLSNLDDVRRALDGRMSRLAAEMDARRAELTAMNRGLRAIDGYGGRSAGRER